MSSTAAPKSIVHGPSHPPLKLCTIGQLLRQQADRVNSRRAVVEVQSGARLTYHDLEIRAKQIARALIASGVQRGDRIAIFLGNCEVYVEIFFAVARIGAVAVLLHGTYTPNEARNVLRTTECSTLFISSGLGNRGSRAFLSYLEESNMSLAVDVPSVKRIVLVHDDHPDGSYLTSWTTFLVSGDTVSPPRLSQLEDEVGGDTVCSFLLTSGTTGVPKVAMLTHANIINNAFLAGNHMALTEESIICNPLPLFHSGGLILGLMTCVVHGACIVFPAPSFSASRTLDCLSAEKCTGMHGVPTMFAAVLRHRHPQPMKCPIRLKTGLIGGSAPSEALWLQIKDELGVEDFSLGYGMTETSGAVFMSKPEDADATRMPRSLAILPHTSAKVVDSRGEIVTVGQRGELCVSGYLVQKGYFNNGEKTRAAIVQDENGTLWMRTGDEAFFDREGNCSVTGRIKDIIIRGGENLYPTEIEDRLSEHPSVQGACVVGLPDDYLGQVVAAFIQQEPGTERPSLEELAAWVRLNLSYQKAPTRVFWLGDDDLPRDFPLLGSGKIRKNVLEEIGCQKLCALDA
ncbi:putative long-chain-fatty-acid-CoA ligase [Aspergillus fijiensis CBS 313.89]|uniref:Putative long-chain-fatty-acid-CoA ligase n=1 Tax=Aspergillus fijiensis CBS 313.89 TaxID=1448319 RepID=A0A8G1VWS1_9EURO|nr:putative long-chain-fatty-acid-CoA ligase [Aspergillus fijiensis CBS 313.89]RAK72289.1 putative long-chain-fatty-acid-CoA ligase [Aspergillus fijiensis CBS 313.89]